MRRLGIENFSVSPEPLRASRLDAKRRDVTGTLLGRRPEVIVTTEDDVLDFEHSMAKLAALLYAAASPAEGADGTASSGFGQQARPEPVPSPSTSEGKAREPRAE
jgi:hypothetical protein